MTRKTLRDRGREKRELIEWLNQELAVSLDWSRLTIKQLSYLKRQVKDFKKSTEGS